MRLDCPLSAKSGLMHCSIIGETLILSLRASLYFRAHTERPPRGGPSDIRLSNCFLRGLVPVMLALVSSNFALGWQNASRSGHRLAEAGTAEPPRVTYAGRAAYEIVRGQ